MKRIASLGAMAMLAALAGTLLLSGSASAHERRNVGAFTFVVGFLAEPALLNQPNSIDLRISHTADMSPVTGAEKTMKAEISFGDQKLPVDLTPRFGTPGAYNAPFTPTKAGAYTFKFTGTLEGANITESFTSGPSTFGMVEEPKAFPQPLPVIQDVAKSVDALKEGSGSSSSSSGSSSSSSGDTALIIAIVSLIVGGAGLGAGVYALSKRSA